MISNRMMLVPTLLLLAYYVAVAAAAAVDDVARDVPRVIESISGDLDYDEKNHLAKHTLVFDSANTDCIEMIQTDVQKRFLVEPLEAERFDLVGLEGHAYDRVFGPYKNENSGCLVASIERGVDRELAGYVMPEFVFDSAKDGSIMQWYTKRIAGVEICLMNYHSHDHPLKIYWRNPKGELVHHLSMMYGNQHTRCFHTFLGHHFVAKDESDPANPFVVGELTVEFITVKAWGQSPPSDQREDSHSFEAEIVQTLKNEWKRHNRIKRTFSPLGFKKGRLPNDVYAALGAFYYNNIENVVREEWRSRGVFVNWWETDVLFLQIPWDTKLIYQSRLRTMVEEWAGIPVEETVMYGLRQYTTGARLLTHVDRHETHAVSLIVNVAQGNLTEPWPVEVQDHADRLHEVIMEPGDVVYYESAKALHARNRPMMGKNAYYVNMFTHYKPSQQGQWWKEENPEGTPAPILGGKPIEEDCRLVKRGIAPTGPNGHSVGLVEGVECDNPDLGDYVSPALFQANGPEDLIDWWRRTSPDYEERPRGEAAAGASSQEQEL